MELACIVSHRKTFVNAENTTDSSVVLSTFLCRIDNMAPRIRNVGRGLAPAAPRRFGFAEAFYCVAGASPRPTLGSTCTTNYSASITVLQTESTLLMTGTQVWLP